jgi:asparagine synthase (glutamine-hydrolysing)
MYRDCHDVTIARRIAAQTGQSHEVISVGHDFLKRFPHYAERSIYLTDGCVEVTRAPDLFVNERARQIAPVRMTGNYGGEVLRRVRAFKPVDPEPGLFDIGLAEHIARSKHVYHELVSGHPLSFAVFKQQGWFLYGSLSLEQTQLALRSPFLDNEFVRTVFRAPQAALQDNTLSLRLIAEGDSDLRGLPTDRGIGGNDFSRRLLEFSFKAEYAYDYGMPQWVAEIDHFFRALRLERLFIGRHKFYHYRVWYRDFLSHYVREILLDRRSLTRPYIQSSAVQRIVAAHTKGHRNYTSEIHKLLSLELVHRLFLDRPRTLDSAAVAPSV